MQEELSKLAGQHSWFEKEGTKCLKNHSNGTSRDLKDICKVAKQATNGLQAKLKLVEDERTKEAGWTQDLLVLEKARKNFPGVVSPAKLVRADCVQQDLHSLPHACRECAETTEWVRGDMCQFLHIVGGLAARRIASSSHVGVGNPHAAHAA